MALARTNVTIPEELLRQVDELAGPRGRSQYVADAIARQVRRDRLRRVLDETAASVADRKRWMTDEEMAAYIRGLRNDADRERRTWQGE
jgi:metal-responsive CopG/Arc/MetJ family transcriptional regulator